MEVAVVEAAASHPRNSQSAVAQAAEEVVDTSLTSNITALNKEPTMEYPTDR